MNRSDGPYRVLLPVHTNEDRARRAAETVVSLPGDPDGISVVVLNVFEEFEVTDEGGTVTSADLHDEETLPDAVDVAVETLEAAGIAAEVRQIHGDPADEIVAAANGIDADCIALSGRKRSPAGKALFGSVTQSVLLSTDRPVLSVLSE